MLQGREVTDPDLFGTNTVHRVSILYFNDLPIMMARVQSVIYI
jgi:hypothetical protein